VGSARVSSTAGSVSDVVVLKSWPQGSGRVVVGRDLSLGILLRGVVELDRGDLDLGGVGEGRSEGGSSATERSRR
jgi:hypothetical protein